MQKRNRCVIEQIELGGEGGREGGMRSTNVSGIVNWKCANTNTVNWPCLSNRTKEDDDEGNKVEGKLKDNQEGSA